MDIDLRPWHDEDLGLMQRLLGDPGMMRHLGGPESPEKILKRHLEFVQSGLGSEAECVRVIVADSIPAGWIGYWQRSWREQRVYETGWSVLPELQGRGLATGALQILLRDARDRNHLQFMHAFPAVDNAPSNAICRKAGFTLLGPVDLEYPPGNMMRCNDWQFDLGQRGASG